MTDNDLYLKIITELENKKAYEEVDDIAKYLQKTIGTAIDKTNLKFSELGKDGKTSIYYKLLKQGDSFLKIPLEIENETGKVLRKKGNISFATKKDLQYFSGIPSEYFIPKGPNNKGLKKNLSSFGKIVNRFKSYGLLRLIRSMFVSIEQGFAQGIQQLAMFDKSANDTLSNITSHLDKIKGSIAIGFAPILDAIAPVISDIANKGAEIAESISIAQSMSKGLSTYTKLSDKYIKNYANTLNKLNASFDKFETLNGKETPFETGYIDELSESQKRKAEQLRETLASVKGFISALWMSIKETLRTIDWESLAEDILSIVPHLITFTEWIIRVSANLVSFIADNEWLVKVVLALVAGYASLKAVNLGSWFVNTGKTIVDFGKKVASASKDFGEMYKSLSTTEKYMASGAFLASFTAFYAILNQFKGGAKIIAGLTVAVAGLAVAMIALKKAEKGNWMGAVIGAGAMTAGIVASISGLQEIKYMANGGIAKDGDLFVANEKGPELVYSGHNNASSVMNISQFKEAVVEAIYETSDVFQSQGDVVLNLDGAEIARSKRFTEEVNRKNSGIKLK